jgi:hypothetical protein
MGPGAIVHPPSRWLLGSMEEAGFATAADKAAPCSESSPRPAGVPSPERFLLKLYKVFDYKSVWDVRRSNAYPWGSGHGIRLRLDVHGDCLALRTRRHIHASNYAR